MKKAHKLPLRGFPRWTLLDEDGMTQRWEAHCIVCGSKIYSQQRKNTAAAPKETRCGSCTSGPHPRVLEDCTILLHCLKGNPGANTNGIRDSTGMRFSKVKRTLEFAIYEGLVSTARGPNNAVLHTITDAGVQWLGRSD